MNVREVQLAPAAVRGRALVLASEAIRPIAHDAPETVMGLTDLVYDALAVVLERRRSLPSAARESARSRPRRLNESCSSPFEANRCPLGTLVQNWPSGLQV